MNDPNETVRMEGDLKITESDRDGTTYEHPSYGRILFSRTHSGGDRPLFGSSLSRHYTTVRVTIGTCRRIHQLSHDRYYGHDELIEVEMSAAQFAEAITTMNVGAGVPCTLRRVNGEMIPGPPACAPLETKAIRDSHAKNIAETAKKLEALHAKAEEMLSRKTLNAKERAELLGAIRSAGMHFRSNQKFALDSFEEATEKVVSAAKTEIDATMQMLIRDAGLDALREKLSEAPPVPQLPAKEEV